jgi:hypothetical protein
MAAEIATHIAQAGINLRGFSAACLGERFVAYVGVDTLEEVHQVRGALEIFDAVHA